MLVKNKIAVITCVIVIFTWFGVSKICYGDTIYTYTTPQEYIDLLNYDAERLNMHVVFRCQNLDAEFPVIEVHSPYSKKGLKMFKEATRMLMHDVSVVWFSITGSSIVYMYEVGSNLEDLEDDKIVYILKKGELIEGLFL